MDRIITPLKLLLHTPRYISYIVMHPIIFIKIFYPFIILPLIIFYFRKSPLQLYIIALQIYSVFYPITTHIKKSFQQGELDFREIIIHLITLLCYIVFYYIQKSIILLLICYTLYYNIVYIYIYNYTKDENSVIKFVESYILYIITSIIGYGIMKFI